MTKKEYNEFEEFKTILKYGLIFFIVFVSAVLLMCCYLDNQISDVEYIKNLEIYKESINDFNHCDFSSNKNNINTYLPFARK
jgi:hypothetical protein